MFKSLRNRLPDIEETGTAAADRVVKAASTAAQSAKDVTVQLAQEGIDCAKKRPLMWGAASLGIGAVMGGLWALLRQSTPVSGPTPPLRSRAKTAKRAPAKAPAKTNGAAPKKGASKARHNGASAGT